MVRFIVKCIAETGSVRNAFPLPVAQVVTKLLPSVFQRAGTSRHAMVLAE